MAWPYTWQPLISFLSLWICPLLPLHINGTIQYVAYCAWLLSLSIMFILVSYVSNHIQTKMNSDICSSVPLKKIHRNGSVLFSLSGKLLLGSLWQELALLLQNTSHHVPKMARASAGEYSKHLCWISPWPLAWSTLPALWLGQAAGIYCPTAQWGSRPAAQGPPPMLCLRGSSGPWAHLGLTSQDSKNRGKNTYFRSLCVERTIHLEW